MKNYIITITIFLVIKSVFAGHCFLINVNDTIYLKINASVDCNLVTNFICNISLKTQTNACISDLRWTIMKNFTLERYYRPKSKTMSYCNQNYCINFQGPDRIIVTVTCPQYDVVLTINDLLKLTIIKCDMTFVIVIVTLGGFAFLVALIIMALTWNKRGLPVVNLVTEANSDGVQLEQLEQAK